MPIPEAIIGHPDQETKKSYTDLRAENLVEAVVGIEAENIAVCNRSVARSQKREAPVPKKFAK